MPTKVRKKNQTLAAALLEEMDRRGMSSSEAENYLTELAGKSMHNAMNRWATSIDPSFPSEMAHIEALRKFLRLETAEEVGLFYVPTIRLREAEQRRRRPQARGSLQRRER